MKVQRGDAALATARGVTAIAWFHDPFGFRHELVTGQKRGAAPFAAGHEISGFVTGDQGLGHIVLIVPDLNEATDFYVDLLGFRTPTTSNRASASASCTAIRATTPWRSPKCRACGACTT